MKNMLLPTDFSQNAWNAIFTAIKLYGPLACRFYLLHTYEPKLQNVSGFKSTSRAGNIYGSMAAESKGELDKIKEYLLKNHKNKDHVFETLSISGGLVESIQTLIPKLDIDNIIMGTHGVTGSEKFHFGSNTLKVIRGIDNCTMLLVPGSFNFQRLKSLAFPTDYMHFVPKNMLFSLLELMEVWKSEIHMFYVAQEFKLSKQQENNKEVLMERFKKFPVTPHDVPMSSNVADAILKFIDGLKMDLVVLTKHSHGFFERLTREPIVKKVGTQTSVPLLVLPGFGGN
ncbi:MAG TPA: universal stress protein [Allomuricauda sp.]|nr:universal stress protein [Allomuricauda sp.]